MHESWGDNEVCKDGSPQTLPTAYSYGRAQKQAKLRSVLHC